MVLKKTSDTGWSIKASIIVSEGPNWGNTYVPTLMFCLVLFKNEYHLCNVVYCYLYNCFIAIEVSVKPASSSQVTTKRVTLNLNGTIPAMESIEDLSAGGKKNVNE